MSGALPGGTWPRSRRARSELRPRAAGTGRAAATRGSRGVARRREGTVPGTWVSSLQLGRRVLGTSARAFAPTGRQKRGRPGPRRARAVQPRGSLVILCAQALVLGVFVSNLALEMGETLSCALVLLNTSNLKRSGTDTLGPFVQYFGSSKARFGCSVPRSLNFSIAAEKCAL